MSDPKEVSWVTKDGQVVKPDEKGVWPAASSADGKTIISGPGKTDQV